MRLNRLFVPLAKEPFLWFSQDIKCWELRKYGRQYTEKNVYINRLVELRLGYNSSQSIWGKIAEVYIFNTLEELFNSIDIKQVLPKTRDIKEAIYFAKRILRIQNEFDTQYIIFRIEKIEAPEFIQMSTKYIQDILVGHKRTTIRKGERKYKKGKCFICFDNNTLIVEIKDIRYIRFKELSINDALNDGFNTVDELKRELQLYYGQLLDDQILSIVEFSINMEG